jgi:hypothetical protein
MGPIGCPEMSLNNYKPKLRNIAEERLSHLHRGGSLSEECEIFQLFGYMITNDVVCRHDIKSRMVVAKAAFTEMRTPFMSQRRTFKEESSKALRLERRIVWC